MKELVTLIYGQAWGDLTRHSSIVLVETPEDQVLTYFGEGLRDTVADLDAGVLRRSRAAVEHLGRIRRTDHRSCGLPD